MKKPETHSPGPFGSVAALSSDPYNIRYITDAEGNMLAAVRSGFSPCNPDTFGQDTALANAALFKAAPAMLAALKVIQEQLALLPAAHIGNKIVHFAFMQAGNAIALAEGEK